MSGDKISGSGVKTSLALTDSAPDNCLKWLYGMSTSLNNTAKVPVDPQKPFARFHSCTVGDILFPPLLNIFFFFASWAVMVTVSHHSAHYSDDCGHGNTGLSKSFHVTFSKVAELFLPNNLFPLASGFPEDC